MWGMVYDVTFRILRVFLDRAKFDGFGAVIGDNTSSLLILLPPGGVAMRTLKKAMQEAVVQVPKQPINQAQDGPLDLPISEKSVGQSNDDYFENLITLTSYLKASPLDDELALVEKLPKESLPHHHRILRSGPSEINFSLRPEKAPVLGTPPFRFHWADCSDTCLLEKMETRATKRGQMRYEHLLGDLKGLEQTPVWIRGAFQTVHSNLFDLYEHFLDMPFRKALDAGKDILISTSSQAGPYVPLMSHRWQEKNILREFILRKILVKKMPLRQFRVRSNLPAKIFFLGSDVDDVKLELIQITGNGFLFRWKSPRLRAKLQENGRCYFTIDISNVNNYYQIETKQEAENSLQFWCFSHSFFRPSMRGGAHSTGPDQEEFLFVRFSDMREGGGTTFEKNILGEVVAGDIRNAKRAASFFTPFLNFYGAAIRHIGGKLMGGLVKGEAYDSERDFVASIKKQAV